jgi:hypothetical protein
MTYDGVLGLLGNGRYPFLTVSLSLDHRLLCSNASVLLSADAMNG